MAEDPHSGRKAKGYFSFLFVGKVCRISKTWENLPSCSCLFRLLQSGFSENIDC